MKFIHIADMHFDMPFTLLEKNGLSEERRIQQRNIFHRLIEYIQKNKIELLFISGDLYEHEYVRKSTIEYINKCFQEIEETTQIFIAPGNHDPYLYNSYYQQFQWNKNVKIFQGLEKVELENINIYGYGFTDFYSDTIKLPKDLEKGKMNIMVMHADLNGAKNKNINYNPILETQLENSDFDYIALGHIHKNNLQANKKYIYPGSTIAGGFDELGEHGMVEGNILLEEKSVDISFKKLDEQEFKIVQIDISSIASIEELMEAINHLVLEKNNYYKIELKGIKNIEIDINELLKHTESNRILKIKDLTKIKYDLEKLGKEKNLRGIFVNEFLQKINSDKANEEEILRMIEIGLNAMEI